METRANAHTLRSLIGVSLGFFGGAGVVAIYGAVLGELKYDAGLAGWLLAAPALTGSLLRIPSATRADAVGARRPFMALGWLGVIGLVVTSAAVVAGLDPLWLLPIGALSGCGMATFSVGAAQLSWSSPPERTGTIVGLYGGFANLGPTLALLLLPTLRPILSLSWLPLVWAAISAVCMTLYMLLAKEPTRRAPSPSERIEREAPRAPLGPAVWWLTLAYFAGYGSFVALGGWLPWLWDKTGQGAEWALWFVMIVPIVRMMTGWLADRVGGMVCLLVASAIAAASAAALAMTTFWAWQFPLAVGMGAIQSATFALLPRLTPRQIGRASGIVGGLGATGGFILPPILGALVLDGAPRHRHVARRRPARRDAGWRADGGVALDVGGAVATHGDRGEWHGF